jgi:SAM-dependent methyltransferase
MSHSTSSPAGTTDTVAPNYAYWRAHGGEWEQEYRKRKTTQVLYHIQEMMLTSYMLRTAQACGGRLRVLEFGCGPGRHLRNLVRLPGVEPFGYDQSLSMTRGALAWCEPEWLDAHVRVGMPTGRLPYDDASFDVVYSAEVLVHVRPEDLPGVLSELLRVARLQVLHLEPSPGVEVSSAVHDGCWNHDLPGAYRALGRECEVLPNGYEVHTPFRVALDGEPPYTWPAEILEMCRRMERDLRAGFRHADEQLAQAWARGDEANRLLEAQRTAFEAQGAALRAELDAERARLAEALAQARALESELAATREELAARDATLAATRGELAARDAMLATTREELAGVSQAHAQAQTALADARAALEAGAIEARRRDAEHARIVAGLGEDLRLARESLAVTRDELVRAQRATRTLHETCDMVRARLRRTVGA